jgi:phenylacetate-coenzyme A ligase PaaK-like adenylate-forming protein
MAAHDNLKMVSEMIISNKVNTLVGMPSYIIQLLKENLEDLKEYGKLKKIFFGGEHFSEKQREWIKSELNVEIIRSAAYGSVDAGPLGFQCPSCEGSIHHLLDSNQSLEILEIENDKPCAPGVTGRLVFTSKNREVLNIKRYDLGDLGKWVDGICPCGRKTPRFELQGRAGDIFRAGGTFINFQKIEHILRNKFEYSGESQIVISKHEGVDKLELFLDEKFSNDPLKQVEKEILAGYHELYEAAIREKGMLFKLSNINGPSFCRTSGSGKLKRVVDSRED